MSLFKSSVVASLILASSAAEGDTTAVYHPRDNALPFSMSVEIADNGKVRYQMSAGRTYGLVVDGVDYFISVEPKGSVVDRADDLLAAQAEAFAALTAKLSHQDAVAGPELVPIGTVTINGRTGQAYGYKKGAAPNGAFVSDPDPPQIGITTKHVTDSEAKEAIARTVVVISDDPDLAQLGKAMAKQFGKSLTMLTRMVGDTPTSGTQMEAILKTGAPLSFAGMELQSVNHAPIDPKRFELPGPPETLDQIRERMKPLPPPPTVEPTKP